MSGDPDPRRSAELPLLPGMHGLDRRPELLTVTGLDLHKGDLGVSLHDEINIPPPIAKAMRHDRPAISAQPARRNALTKEPEVLSLFRHGASVARIAPTCCTNCLRISSSRRVAVQGDLGRTASTRISRMRRKVHGLKRSQFWSVVIHGPPSANSAPSLSLRELFKQLCRAHGTRLTQSEPDRNQPRNTSGVDPCRFRLIRVIRDKVVPDLAGTPALVTAARLSTAHAENSQCMAH